MTLSLQNQRDSLRRATGEDTTDLDNTEADLLLNRSWWEIASVFKFREKQTSRTFVTVAGTVSYAIAADHNATQIVSIKDINSSAYEPLAPMSEAEYESNFIDTTAARGKPTHCLRRGSNIILWPTPDTVYTVKELYDKTLADVASDPSVGVPQEWHEMIWIGAAFRRFLENGDVNKAYSYRKIQGLPSLAETKEETQTKERGNTQFAAVQMLRPRYP